MSKQVVKSPKMKINKDLLAIKGHYFLRYAGTGPLALLLPVMVRSKGLSEEIVGLLWTVLPVVGLIINSISGTLADYFKAYRIVFLGSVISLTTGIVSIYWAPKFPIAKETINITSVRNVTLQSINNSSLLLDLGLADVDSDMVVAEDQVNPFPLQSSEEPLVTPGEDTNLLSLVNYPQFWLIFFALMVEQMGISTCVMISDAVCFQILGSHRQKYGRQRLWGTIGMGVMAIVSGLLTDVYSQGLPEKDYFPAVVMCVIIMLADVILISKMKIPYPSDHKFRIKAVGATLNHPCVLLFLMTVFVMGVSFGVLWVFKLMLVEDIALAWNPAFGAIKFLQGLVIAIESFLGEVPFFFVSGMIIERLGHTAVLAMSLLSMVVRCSLYYTVTNPWCFLPIELLNGLSYSLFHSVMVSYASFIAPPGAQATLQSVVRATFSVGLSTAGFVGGFLYNTWGGSIAFLQIGLLDLGYLLVFVLLHFLIKKYYGSVTGEMDGEDLQSNTKVDAFPSKPAETQVIKEAILLKKCSESSKNKDERVRFLV